ncbi:ATP-dependent RNA helicase DbpA [Pseudomonas monteilii]|uniref:23S rRNA specific ATP-dependent RNA helicase n=2 Tax=Pseudomonas TaxID=286 RepID=A0AAE6V5I9_9PSED|nr:ATP-independent RNA helicase DbpA [Pseudomonas sp. OG7]MBH3453283.1 ATP-dependent RNA helicase DbpA [Pseudomonas monteilii]PXX70079.1 ATP-dependent RNA helicase DbpA [Pseudomonas sp. LAIL14HWK12:I1]SNB54581.1 ATP-dependent RNA helicase DbpA [Pseudomonas sp. URIL14HWK12:I8]SNS35771.1 ATP-dependent RNA helicase DbpA [Pseudomonas sp. LAMO17WK12:I8]SNY01001.1 ATP-dependent RNA helicase DbpA [Pseudomonas sp. LAMO17WK12:I12]SNY01442.1 ATP-dependent RNA helicase DbpA [Pseudomonas sp. LAMO17WK12:I
MTTESTAFATLPLSAAMLANLDALGYASMTPIQAQSLPVILKGQDLIAQAKTGSGKTAAFGIGLLNPINPRYFGCQALVLCPTRELADQVAKELRRLARAEDNIKILTLCGGVSLGPQIASLEHGAHIIVGTPGRIQQHLDKGTLVLDGLNTLVLDEADRMLDMGFFDAIASIIGKTPSRRQTLLFSATYPAGIKQLAADFMRNPQQVKVESLHTDNQIEQRFIEIDPQQRLEAVTRVLGHYRPQSCVAFCFTKQQCEDVVAHLTAKGIVAQALHGDLEQRDRDQVLTMFANRSSSVLVATDVAARGLDIDGLDMVINVELARDAEIHVHRVGRTGRAGEKGVAVSLVAPAEGHRAQAIEALQKSPLRWDQLDSLKNKGGEPLLPVMSTLCIAAGRKDKLRPGDILGALTGDAGIPGKQVGKIAIFDFQAFVAVERALAKQAMQRLNSGKIKGRSLKVRII